MCCWWIVYARSIQYKDSGMQAVLMVCSDLREKQCHPRHPFAASVVACEQREPQGCR